VPPAPTVSVVIPVRDAAHLVAEQLAALEAQSYADFEVVVADNGSTDDTVEVVHGASGGLRLRVVDASGRPGVSHARNVGARYAAASKILFCDADDVADPGWVACMAAALDEAELVGGHLEVTSVNPPQVLAWAGSPTAQGLPVTMAYLPYAVGANLGVRRAVLDTVGEFDETYVGGHEEVDLAWKVQQAGMRVRFAPDAVIHYRLRGSLRGMARQRYWYGRSYAQLYRAFRGSGVEPTPLRRELRFYAVLVRSLPRDVRKGRFGFWLGTAAWTAGRLAGDLRFRVRCPL
jgi:GT2 family glycosyltransferase